MPILRILTLTLAHFTLAALSSFAAYGLDLDQLRDRSPWSRAAGAVHDVLWFPHDATIRAIPNAWLVRHAEVIPLTLVASSLAWGVVLYTAWRWLRVR